MAGAEAIARALGGRRVGAGWMARCPAHADHVPSLSIREGEDCRLLVRCHAGCEQAAVIDALRSKGLWPGSRPARRAMPRRPDPGDPADDVRTRSALAIWQATRPAAGTPVERYLAGRGLRLPEAADLRFHPGLRHRDGGTWPAMVALVVDGADGRHFAVHRTFLARDGGGKAPVEPARMMLGPCRGGGVRLGAADSRLLIGEGIETCLAAMQATGTPAWAALSTSGLTTLALPREVREVVVLADGDAPGEAAARSCAERWVREGRRVRIARPPRGMDFNDLLPGRTTRVEGGAP